MTKAAKARRNGEKGRGGSLQQRSEGAKQSPAPLPKNNASHSRDELLAISQHISSNYRTPEAPKTQVFLAEIDPHKVHASWSIRKDDYDLARGSVPAKRVDKEPVISVRLYDVTDRKLNGAARMAFTDVAVHGLSNNWYIDLNKPARSFVADIGLMDSLGRFVRLATSNRIHTPPAGPSPMATYVQIEAKKTPAMRPTEPAVIPPMAKKSSVGKKKPVTEQIPVGHYAWLPPEVMKLSPGEKAHHGTQDYSPVQKTGQEKTGERKPGFPATTGESIVASPKGVPAREEGAREMPSQPAPSASSPIGSSWMSGVGLGCSLDVQELQIEVRISGRAAPNKEIEVYGKKVKTDAEGRFSIQAQVPADSWVAPLLMDQILSDRGERGL